MSFNCTTNLHCIYNKLYAQNVPQFSVGYLFLYKVKKEVMHVLIMMFFTLKVQLPLAAPLLQVQCSKLTECHVFVVVFCWYMYDFLW